MMPSALSRDLILLMQRILSSSSDANIRHVVVPATVIAQFLADKSRLG